MSRNYELIQRSGAQSDFASASDLTRPLSNHDSNGNGNRNGSSLDLQKMAKDELLKFVRRVFFTPGKERVRIVVFAGVDLEDGSASLCAAAAKILARNAFEAICLVDAQSHSTVLPRLLGFNDRCGLAESLLREGPIRNFTQQLTPENLSVLPCGSSGNSRGLFRSERLKMRVAELRNEFEYVLINAPPVLLDGTACLLGALADGLVLIVEANTTHREVARKAKELLRSANVRLLGAIFNNRTFPIPASVYSRL